MRKDNYKNSSKSEHISTSKISKPIVGYFMKVNGLDVFIQTNKDETN